MVYNLIMAVVVAPLSTFMIGGLWNSPAVFEKVWMKENGFTKESLKTRTWLKSWSDLFAGVHGYDHLAMFIGPETRSEIGAFRGFLPVLTG